MLLNRNSWTWYKSWEWKHTLLSFFLVWWEAYPFHCVIFSLVVKLRTLEEFWPRSVYHPQDRFTPFFCCLAKCPARQEALTGEKRQRTKIKRIITLADSKKFLYFFLRKKKVAINSFEKFDFLQSCTKRVHKNYSLKVTSALAFRLRLSPCQAQNCF